MSDLLDPKPTQLPDGIEPQVFVQSLWLIENAGGRHNQVNAYTFRSDGNGVEFLNGPIKDTTSLPVAFVSHPVIVKLSSATPPAAADDRIVSP